MKYIINFLTKLYKWFIAGKNAWVWGFYYWRIGTYCTANSKYNYDDRDIDNIEDLYNANNLCEYSINETISLRYPNT